MSSERLLMVLHSNSLKETINEDKEAVTVLLECAKMEESLVLATPVADVSIWEGTIPEGIFQIRYEDRGDGTFVASYKTEHLETASLCHDFIPSGMITDKYGIKEDSTEFTDIRNAFHDLMAFESISRQGDSIFVTQNHHLLDKNVWIQRRFDVKILSFVQALEYFDLYLKRRDLYYGNPQLRILDGRAFHYWFLLKDIVPKFREAWSISVYGRNVIQNGQNIFDALHGFANRFQNALCSSDRIAMEYVKQPINSTQWEMLYNLNYFCMLATGVFDSLAWLTVYRYSIPIRCPYQVSIRITKRKSRGDKFVTAISKHNSSLASFIRTHQDFINLFYPMRDAAQHREPVGGAQFQQGDEGWTASLAELKPDAVLAIKKVDQKGYPFTKWGLLNIAGFDNLLEPHRFTRKALRDLMAFANEYIDLLDIPALIASHQDLINKIAVLPSKEPKTPFIAQTYLRRDSYLPILFRNR